MTLMETAQLLGNFGEFIGAIAVVATLFYLAVQVRESKQATEANTKAIAGNSAREVLLSHANWHLELARDPELKRILIKSCQPQMEEYSPEERHEFTTYLVSVLQVAQAYFVNRDLEIGYEGGELWLESVGGFIKRYPAWRKAFDDLSGLLDPRFVDALSKSEEIPFDMVSAWPNDADPT